MSHASYAAQTPFEGGLQHFVRIYSTLTIFQQKNTTLQQHGAQFTRAHTWQNKHRGDLKRRASYLQTYAQPFPDKQLRVDARSRLDLEAVGDVQISI